MKELTVVAAMCGSFCTFAQVLPQWERLAGQGIWLRPVMSQAAAGTDTRFGRADDWKTRLEQAGIAPVITTVDQAEPLGPQNMADAMVIAPCTGNTLAKLAAGIVDGPVTMAAKSMLRVNKPVVVAFSTNDGLAAAAQNIGRLLNTRNFYFVPFGQDDPAHKPHSLQADFSLLGETLRQALEGRQIQPLLRQK